MSNEDRDFRETRASRYLLDEMSASERAEFEFELQENDSLRQEVTTLRSTIAWLQQSARVSLDEEQGLGAMAHQALEDEARAHVPPTGLESSTLRSSTSPLGRWAKAAAILVLAGGGTFLGFQLFEETPSSKPSSTLSLSDSNNESALASLVDETDWVEPTDVLLREGKTVTSPLSRGEVVDQIAPEKAKVRAALKEWNRPADPQVNLDRYKLETRIDHLQQQIDLAQAGERELKEGRIAFIEPSTNLSYALIPPDNLGSMFATYGYEATPQESNSLWSGLGDITAANQDLAVLDSFGVTKVDSLSIDEARVAQEEAKSPVLSLGAPMVVGNTATLDVGITLSKEQVAQRIEAVFQSLSQKPNETPEMMFHRYWGDNRFVATQDCHESTFSVDVDTASYTLARRYLKEGNLPPTAAVRTEEFVNYFDHDIAAPTTGDFYVNSELAPSPFVHTDDLRLLRIGLKAREVEIAERKSCRLVFVIDVSGSMRDGGRLELVKSSLRLLVDQLDEGDRIGIVAFNDHGFEVLDPIAASEKDRVLTAISSLSPGGSTNANEGLTLGYAMAEKSFQEGANNRVVLCSDGVANTGTVKVDGILLNVSKQREQGILLNTVGVGMGNHNDTLLEQLADRGDGMCVYVDSEAEAKRAFVDELTSTVETIARDVKVQVDFNEDAVAGFRQLGYENRALAAQDFRNDQVDAGEVGAGHEVVALYEVQITGENLETPLAEVRVRYKNPDIPDEVSEISHQVSPQLDAESFEVASPSFQMSAVVGEFAELLRRSYWAQAGTLDQTLSHANRLATLTQHQDHIELAALIRQASQLRKAQPDDLAQSFEQFKKSKYLIAKLQDELSEARAKKESEKQWLEELREHNKKLEEILRQKLAEKAQAR